MHGSISLQFPGCWSLGCYRRDYNHILWPARSNFYVAHFKGRLLLHDDSTDARNEQSPLDATHPQVWPETRLHNILYPVHRNCNMGGCREIVFERACIKDFNGCGKWRRRDCWANDHCRYFLPARTRYRYGVRQKMRFMQAHQLC
jgi:hypothetical protein